MDILRSYVSAVRGILKEDGIETNNGSVELAALLKSCKYTSKPSGYCRLPIQQGLLDMIVDQIDKYFLVKKNQPYLCLLYNSILLMGYYGLLRIGEMTDAEGKHMINLNDVYFDRNGEKILIILHSSKTLSEVHKPQIIKIHKRNGTPCPCKIITEYLFQRGDILNRKKKEPLFLGIDLQ